jgi:hypothetical protein
MSELGLFGDSEPPAASRPVGPATVEADLLVVAAHLPAGIHLGTSSWNFPGWATLVYDRIAEERSSSVLAWMVWAIMWVRWYFSFRRSARC